jgi:hypothetical protein
LWVPRQDEGWAVGSLNHPSDGTGAGLMLHYQAGTWSAVPLPALAGIKTWWLGGISMSSSGEGWAVGVRSSVWAVGSTIPGASQAGIISHFDGASWAQVAAPSSLAGNSSWRLDAVTFRSGVEGWAVGKDLDAGIILRYANP